MIWSSGANISRRSWNGCLPEVLTDLPRAYRYSPLFFPEPPPHGGGFSVRSGPKNRPARQRAQKSWPGVPGPWADASDRPPGVPAVPASVPAGTERCFSTNYYMSTISTFPNLNLTFFKYLSHLNIF